MSTPDFLLISFYVLLLMPASQSLSFPSLVQFVTCRFPFVPSFYLRSFHVRLFERALLLRCQSWTVFTIPRTGNNASTFDMCTMDNYALVDDWALSSPFTSEIQCTVLQRRILKRFACGHQE